MGSKGGVGTKVSETLSSGGILNMLHEMRRLRDEIQLARNKTAVHYLHMVKVRATRGDAFLSDKVAGG